MKHALPLAAAYALLSALLVPRAIFAKYPHLVESLKQGTLAPERAGDASPAYLLLNWLLSPGPLRVAQIGLGALAVLFVFRLATQERGRIAGWTAAILLALCEPWLIYSGVLEPDLPIAALNIAGLALLHRPLVAGTCFGLSLALRPSALPFVLLVLALRRKQGAPLIAASALVSALLPVALLWTVASQDVRSTMAAGQTFHQGHRPESAGLRAGYPSLLKLVEMTTPQRSDQADEAHMLYRRFAAAELGREVAPLEAERFWLKKALAFARYAPGAFLQDLGHKLVFAVAAPGKDSDIDEVLALKKRAWSGIPARWLALLGLGGLLLSLHRLLGAALLAYVFVFVVFYFQSRYGVALVPTFAVLSGIAASELWDARRDWRELLRRGVIVLAPCMLALLPFVRDEARLEERNWVSFPDTVLPWAKAGAPPERSAEGDRTRFGRATRVDAFLLAIRDRDEGRCDLALEDLAYARGFHSAITDVSLDPDLLASDCLLALREPQKAAEAIIRSLEAWPGTLDGLARASAASRKGFLSGAYEAELFTLHDAASAHYALARAYRQWQSPSEALAHLDWLSAHLPESEQIAAHERAQCLLDQGKLKEAIVLYGRTLSLAVRLPGAERFDEPLLRWAEAYPNDENVQRFVRTHFARHGRHF